MFRKLLIANRGEIALRVIRAARALGVRTAVAHSEADAGSLPVRLADEAVCIGPPAPSQSYLHIARIVDAAKRIRADAIHPGYGFLSENGDFAEAVGKAGLAFVGPSPATLRRVGDKLAARALAREIGVPTPPGSVRPVGDAREMKALAKEIGFPVILKAAGGGGGKGIRTVSSLEECDSAFERATSEARQAFGVPDVYVEKRVHPARHVEVQILADAEGRAIHLGERECSIQRRHQKLLEESPSPIDDPGLRPKLCEAAVRIAKASGYVNAGTVEFLVDEKRNFYFLEVNARLQVEHPVTEMVTGIDLVREQLRIAAGHPLSIRQEQVAFAGHALEARILAEDPYRNFSPALGRVERLRLPGGPGVRIDTALFEGMEVTPYYDSLLAKLVCWGSDRAQAIARMEAALGELVIAGFPTTIPFFFELLAEQDVRAGKLRTDFLSGWRPAPVPEDVLEAAAVAAALSAHRSLAVPVPPPSRRSSAWTGEVRDEEAGRRADWHDRAAPGDGAKGAET